MRIAWHGSQCLDEAAARTATPKEARALGTLVERLAYPASWRPASAWSIRQVRAFVPSTFELWYGPWQPGVKLTDALQALPAQARDVLRIKQARRVLGRVGLQSNLVAAVDYRIRVTTEEARLLRAAFTAGGLAPDSRDSDVVLAYDVGARHPQGGAVTVTFVPILPHGEPEGPIG